ncbi:MAG: hypothetical protein DMG91_17745 [Acidobacteria bacterium]|nr:MAG: hypothetical protein DMG91_17745 [Acidobacteriota bacterium]
MSGLPHFAIRSAASSITGVATVVLDDEVTDAAFQNRIKPSNATASKTELEYEIGFEAFVRAPQFEQNRAPSE